MSKELTEEQKIEKGIVLNLLDGVELAIKTLRKNQSLFHLNKVKEYITNYPVPEKEK